MGLLARASHYDHVDTFIWLLLDQILRGHGTQGQVQFIQVPQVMLQCTY